MACINIPNGVICLSKIDFKCPHCEKEHDDRDDKYLNKCNKNKSGITIITCDGCKRKFGMTYDITGQAVSFDSY